MSVFAVERQRRFSTRCRVAWRTRFSCCLIFGIGVKTPATAGLRMVAGGRRDPRGGEHESMDEKRSGGDRRKGADRRAGEERRQDESGPPPEGERRSDPDRRAGADRRTGKDRRDKS